MGPLAGRLVERLRDDPDAPAVLDLEDDTIDEVFDALGSETAREILTACYEEGHTKSDLADRLDTTVQNVTYHLDRLEDAGLIEPAEVRLGEKGQEVEVYEPSKEAVLIAAGETGTVDRIKRTVERLFAPVSLVALLSVVAAVLTNTGEPTLFPQGLSGDSGSSEVPPTPLEVLVPELRPAVTAAMLTLALGLFAVYVADRRGVFDRRPRRKRVGRRAFLLGRDTMRTRGGLAMALVLTLVGALVSHLSSLGSTEPSIPFAEASLVGLAVLLVGGFVLAAMHTARNDGLLVALLLVSAPIIGLFLVQIAGLIGAGDLLSGLLAAVIVFPPIVFVLELLFGLPTTALAMFVGRRFQSDRIATRAYRLWFALVAVVSGGLWLLVLWLVP